MTESLLHTLEEKIICLLEELDCLHDEIKELKQQNHELKTEKATSHEKLQNIVSLLNSFDMPEMTHHSDVREFSHPDEKYLETAATA
jgi:FtsZ-binding cell division protein ZapB